MLGAALEWAGLSQSWSGLVLGAIGFYLGFEVSSIERYMLDRDGWRMVGTVTGRNIAECERRFFETWLPDQPVVTVKPQPSAARERAGLWPFPRT